MLITADPDVMQTRGKLQIDAVCVMNMYKNEQLAIKSFESSVNYLIDITEGLVLDFTKCKNRIINEWLFALEPVFLCEEIALIFNREIEFKNFEEKSYLVVNFDLKKKDDP